MGEEEEEEWEEKKEEKEEKKPGKKELERKIEEKMKLRGRKYIGPQKSSAQIECEKKEKAYR